MQANLEDISLVKKKVVVVVPSDEVDKKIKQAYQEVQQKVKIPGFRQGRVPRQILEKRFADKVAEDVATSLINETLPKAFEDTKAVPLTEPVLEKKSLLKQGDSFKYSAAIEVRPEFEIKDYLEIDIEKEKLLVTEEQVLNRIDKIRESRGDLVSVDEKRPVRHGDYVAIDYEAFEGATPLENMKMKGAIIKVGNGSIHPEFDQALIGLNKGDETRVSIDYADDHTPRTLAGKHVDFNVKILDIKWLNLPDLDDNFAKELDPDIKGLEDLKRKVNELLIKDEEQRIEKEMKQKLLQKISETVDFELPQGIVDAELEQALSNVKQELMEQGGDFTQLGVSEKKVRDDFRAASEKRVKEMFVLGKISILEGLKLSEEEVAKGFGDIAAVTNQPVETIQKYYEANNLMDRFRESLMEEKTLNYLVEHAKVVEV
jgi:trigger factor